MMELTRHATERSQQRAIPKEIVETLFEFGTPQKRPGHATRYAISKKDKERAIMSLKKKIQEIERASKKAVVIDPARDQIITVYNKS
jgi:hypothetical protein